MPTAYIVQAHTVSMSWGQEERERECGTIMRLGILPLIHTSPLLHLGFQLQSEYVCGSEDRVHISIPVGLLSDVYVFAQPEHVRRGGHVYLCRF